MSTPNFNDTTPVAINSDYMNCRWQMAASGSPREISIYVPKRADLLFVGCVIGGAPASAAAANISPFASNTNAAGTAGFQFVSPVKAYVRTLALQTSDTNPNGTVLTCRLVREGFDTSLAAAILPTAVAGQFIDRESVVVLEAGEPFNFETVRQGAAGAILRTFSCEYVPIDTTSCILGSNVDVNITASTTLYPHFGSDFQQTSANESLAHVIVPFACTLRNLFIRLTAGQAASGTQVWTVRKNGVDTSLLVTVPANTVAGVYVDLVNTAVFAAGDILTISRVNNATSTTGTVSCAVLEIVPTGGLPTQIISAYGNQATSANLTYYYTPFAALIDTNALEQHELILTRNGVLKNFYIYGSTADAGIPHTATVYKNGVATALTVSINNVAANTLFSDLVHTVSAVIGDTITVAFVGGNTTGVAGTWSLEYANS